MLYSFRGFSDNWARDLRHSFTILEVLQDHTFKKGEQMVGLQIMVTIQSGNRQEFLQAIDMLCSQQAKYSNSAYDNIFEAVETPNQFFYLIQWTDLNLLEKFLKTDRLKALLGAIQVLGKLETFQIVKLDEIKNISNFSYQG